MAEIPSSSQALRIGLGRAILQSQAPGEQLNVADSRLLLQAASMWIRRHRGALGGLSRAASLGIGSGGQKHVFSAELQQAEILALLEASPGYLRAVINHVLREANQQQFLNFLLALRDIDR